MAGLPGLGGGGFTNGAPTAAGAAGLLSGAGVAGLGLGALGTIGGFLASRQREKAFNAASNTRGAERAGFNNDRQQGLANFEKGLTGVGGEQQAAQLQGLQGLAGLDQTFQQGQEQGGLDMQSALAQILGQAPVGGAFNQATAGPAGAGVQQRIMAQQQPALDAQNQLGAAGLGRLAMAREQGDVLRQRQLGLAGAQKGLQNLQGVNSVNNANIGLADLQSQLRFQQARASAGRKGQGLEAVSGLAQNVGGGLLSGGFT